MKHILFIFLVLSISNIKAQTISGFVKDIKQKPIAGATVYIKNSYDGANTDKNGYFSFASTKKGKQTLVISCLAYEEKNIEMKISEMRKMIINLKENREKLETVTITAGSFSARDNSKVSALSSLDVVTTAGSQGNIVAAFQKLPGMTVNAESGKLFIRGGSSDECLTFIDGMRVFKPYTSSSNNTPVRARYSPMLFKGMSLNTGAYSAEYGQALSGILLLDTKDLPKEDKIDVSILNVGAGLGQTLKRKNKSLSFNTSYSNLKPYLSLFSSRYEWLKPFESFGGEAVYRHKLSKGLFKFYSAASLSRFELLQENINFSKPIKYYQREKDLYLNASYKGILSEKFLIKSGLAYSINNKRDIINSDTEREANITESNIHAKLVIKNIISEDFKINSGVEHFSKTLKQKLSISSFSQILNKTFNTNLSALFSEAEITASENTAFRIGLRADYSSFEKKIRLSPRLAFAQRLGEKNKISFAYGRFYQEANDKYRLDNKNLVSENSSQYIINFEHNSEGRMLKTELYYKKYNNLIRLRNSASTNEGYGSAKGLDVFWKDARSIKNLEYRVSYSFMDSKREYLNYPSLSPTSFTARHNMSFVGKYWIGSIKSLIGFSYTFNSGRPYNNPNKTSFMSETSKAYNDISLSYSYLISPQKILFFSVSNITGFNNVYSYDFAQKRDAQGVFNNMAIRPSMKRFFVLGLFITISKNKKINQLDKL